MLGVLSLPVAAPRPEARPLAASAHFVDQTTPAAAVAPLPAECESEDAFRLELDDTIKYEDMYLEHRARVWNWAATTDIAFECRNETVLDGLYAMRNFTRRKPTQHLVLGNGPLSAELAPTCIDAFEEVVRFNDYSKMEEAGTRTTIHVVNSIVTTYSADAWVVLSLECMVPDIQVESDRLCVPSAEARAQLCSSPPEVEALREAGEWDGGDDDPSRGFLYAALFGSSGLLRLSGFTDDAAHADGTVDEGGEHLIDNHHIHEEHYVMKAAGIGR